MRINAETLHLIYVKRVPLAVRWLALCLSDPPEQGESVMRITRYFNVTWNRNASYFSEQMDTVAREKSLPLDYQLIF